MIAALQTVAPGVGASALALLQSPQPPPIETVLPTLLNELSAAAGRRRARARRLPRHRRARRSTTGWRSCSTTCRRTVHLVIATRADPAAAAGPPARARRAGRDPRRRPALHARRGRRVPQRGDGPGLRRDDIAALEARTEGWIAGLQLAALSMQGRDDAAGFIAAFAGDDRYIVDYLVEEVLQRQPERRPAASCSRPRSSSRLSGPLVRRRHRARTAARRMLEALERGNLFVVPLDDRRQWYRYHHLFADVLQARLADEQPDLVPELHGRASAGTSSTATRPRPSATRSPATTSSGPRGLIELTAPALARRQEPTLAALAARPCPTTWSAPTRAQRRLRRARSSQRPARGRRQRLRDAERWLLPRTGRQAGGRGGLVVVDDSDGSEGFPRAIGCTAPAIALSHGDIAATMAARERADLAPPGTDDLRRARRPWLDGLALWTVGELERGAPALRRSLSRSRGRVRRRRPGMLDRARRTSAAPRGVSATRCARTNAARELARARAGAPLRGTADMHVGMSGCSARMQRRSTPPSSTSHRRHASANTQGLPQNPYRSRMALARIREAEGELDAAIELLDEAERRVQRRLLPGRAARRRDPGTDRGSRRANGRGSVGGTRERLARQTT